MIGQPFIIATAGHVDHGKSSIVKALTGIDPDRLPEEQARGITIDLGFAPLELPAPPGNLHQANRYTCGIVDVPGHEDFVKNMVAGVGSIDLALLVVAADDGWMPQTEEHLQILLYLGVIRAVIVLTKADLAVNLDLALASVRARLAGTPFADAPLVPTSTVRGTGFETLRAAIANVLARTAAPADVGKPRLWIDRVFVLKGVGTVVTGTLAGGSLSRGDAVMIQPRGVPARIRSCQTHGRDVERARPGSRTALNLPDLAPAAPGSELLGVRRGEVVTLSHLGGPCTVLDVVLERSARLDRGATPAARPLKSDALVRLHLGSANVPARLRFLRNTHLGPGQRDLARLRLERPVFGFVGDRFILRDWAEQSTLGGGLILELDPPAPPARPPDRLALLEACAAEPGRPEPFLGLQLHQYAEVPLDQLLVRSRFSSQQISDALGRLRERDEVVLPAGFATRADRWREVLAAAAARIDAHHRDHPEQPGLPLLDLKGALESAHGPSIGFDAVLDHLRTVGFVRHGVVLRRRSHLPSLPPHLRESGQRLREALARHGLEAPSRRELAPQTADQPALRFLVGTGEAIELGPDLVLGAEAFAAARERLRVLLRQRGRATTSELRQALGTSRRILIPLLERLDRDGVTRREGDYRVLVRDRP